MKKLIALIALLLTAPASAEIASLYHGGNHRGACTRHESVDKVVTFEFCSMDNIIPDRPPKKFFRIHTYGIEPVLIDENELGLVNRKTNNKVAILMEKPYIRSTRGIDRTIYTVETAELYVKLFINMAPIDIWIFIDNIPYVVSPDRESQLELAMIAGLE
jgi:hypothetical protein